MNSFCRAVLQLTSAGVLAILTACQTPSGAVPAFSTPPGTNDLVERATHFRFPPHVASFLREGPIQYDASGRDVSVKYRAGRAVIADVYIYPMAGRSIETELEMRKSEITILHPDAKLLAQGGFAINPGGKRQTGMRATFNFSQNFREDIPGPYKSQLLIFRRNDRFIKYRITYTRSAAARAETEINRFFSLLVWPEN